MRRVPDDVLLDVGTDISLATRTVHSARNIVQDAQEVTIAPIVCLDISDLHASILAPLTVRTTFVIRMMAIAVIIV